MVEEREARIGIYVKRIFAQCNKLAVHVRWLGALIFYGVNLENFARLELIYEGPLFERDAGLGARFCGASRFRLFWLG
jgi:hypothetical protein